jgi:hypothetical protein
MTRFRALAATAAALFLAAPATLADEAPANSGGVHNPSQKPCVEDPSFEGLWRIRTTPRGASTNGHFDLRLTVSGDKISGVFTNLDGQPQLNGTLDGTKLKQYGVNSFEFTYSQPQVNVKGKGTYEQSGDGKRISGLIYPEGPTWSLVYWDGDRVNEPVRPAQAAPPSGRLDRAAERAGHVMGRATAIADVDMYIGPSGETPVLGIWRKDSRATPLESREGRCKLQGINGGQDAWVWGEFVSGCN